MTTSLSIARLWSPPPLFRPLRAVVRSSGSLGPPEATPSCLLPGLHHQASPRRWPSPPLRYPIVQLCLSHYHHASANFPGIAGAGGEDLLPPQPPTDRRQARHRVAHECGDHVGWAPCHADQPGRQSRCRTVGGRQSRCRTVGGPLWPFGLAVTISHWCRRWRPPSPSATGGPPVGAPWRLWPQAEFGPAASNFLFQCRFLLNICKN
jgi:hypothetical protein